MSKKEYDLYVFTRGVDALGDKKDQSIPQHGFALLQDAEGKGPDGGKPLCIRFGPARNEDGSEAMFSHFYKNLEMTMGPYKGGKGIPSAHIDYVDYYDEVLPHAYQGSISESQLPEIMSKLGVTGEFVAGYDYKIAWTEAMFPGVPTPGGGQNSNTGIKHVVENVFGFTFKHPTRLVDEVVDFETDTITGDNVYKYS